MLISLFIFYYAGMGYEYLIYIIYKKNTGIIISKKSIIHTPQSERIAKLNIIYIYMYNNDTSRGSICYILYNNTGVCDVSPVFDFSEIDIVPLAQTLKHSFEHTKHDNDVEK